MRRSYEQTKLAFTRDRYGSFFLDYTIEKKEWKVFATGG